MLSQSRKTVAALLLAGVLTPHAKAQEDQADPEVTAQSVIDAEPYVSARAAAMGGALSPIADDVDAAFHNPAGIGGLDWGSTKLPWFRKLYLPHVGASTNENTRNLNKAFKKAGGANDPEQGAAVVDAAPGERQYARANMAVGAVLGRMMFLPFTDYQMAAVSQGDDESRIDARYRTTTGVGFGLSFASFDDSLYLGYFGYSVSISETRGLLTYQQVIDKDARTQALKDMTAKYSGVGHNAGLIWRLANKASPTLAVAMTNIGNTKLRQTSAPETADEPLPEELKIEGDLTIGFGLSPKLGKTGRVNLVLEAARLESEALSIAQKLRLGAEMELWGRGRGSYSLLALRAGVNHAGLSYGLLLNLGLVAFEAASHPVDIGVGNEKVIERRMAGTFSINVAEF